MDGKGMKSKHIAGVLVLLLLLFSCSNGKIDRHALVTRHNIQHSSKDSLSSLTVGNGRFAYTVDITGMQSFPESYEKGIPLGTMSEWGWNTDSNPENYSLQEVYRSYIVGGREVDYIRQFRHDEDARKAAASEWLRANPHRIHLGLVGLEILKKDGSEATLADIDDPVQTLDLWTGKVISRFNVEGIPVEVHTVCHPDYDLVSVKILSGLIKEGRLKIRIRFPFGAPVSFGSDINAAGEHFSEILSDTNNVTLIERRQDNDVYKALFWKNNGILQKNSDHKFSIYPPGNNSEYSFSFHFFKKGEGRIQTWGEAESASRKSWESFWNSGGAVDLSKATDPRAMELERRIILSQYLTKVQCSGSLPPAETGLTFNSWFGKFHLEMHWWHAVHFALWGRAEILKKQMDYYSDILENARKTAEHQGYKGVRWPKMTSPEGMESPSTVGTYLIWQQPHVIFFAEMLYQNAGKKEEILKEYQDIVFATADFMASYARYDNENDRYCLGPVLIPAQESLKLETTVNPAFELVYWHWALRTASEWRSRLSLKPDSLWISVEKKISPPAIQNGLYLCSEDTGDSYSNPRYMSDHPIVSGMLGFLPETGLVDKEILSNSLDTISARWNWKSTWGWDFPMLAMCAASLGRETDAVDFLMMDAPKNRYLVNGHNYQDSRLPVYLPGNGGLLTAVARMCTLDQFPHNGKWEVLWEGLNTYVK